MSHHAPRLDHALLTRREALCRAGVGFGGLALTNLMADAGLLAATPSPTSAANPAAALAQVPFSEIRPLAPRPPQFAPRAKRVIHLFMNGGPSQVDTFDPKPSLTRYAGKPVPLNL